ncbi:MAG: hypothetical protein M3Q48_08865 [Actinomycetota bacterium]|nr:hypothetical protein [Actinomycetota bacterium]
MPTVVSAFWAARGGSPADHYEDAFWPRRPGAQRTRRLRLAVADGATESMLSGLWADLLVRTWCRSRRRQVDDVVAAAMNRWDATMRAYVQGREADRRPIQWFEEPGLARGAHATLLGVELDGDPSSGPLRWSAVSLGDSCLFQVRDDVLVASFPVARADQFGTAPKLVPTRPEQLGRVLAHLERAEGDCRAGDVLFLTTDALAAWFLTEVEAGGAPWRVLRRLEGDDRSAFATWVATQRDRGGLRNDDVTLVRVEVGAP